MTVAHEVVATSEFDALQLPLPEDVLQERFETLQRKLLSQWELIEGFTDEPYGIVVVPSLSGIDLPLDAAKRQAYEERYLFLLFLLRQPRARLVYTRPGTTADVHAAWTTTLGADAAVVGKEQALDEGWFGTVGDDVRDRVPDLVVATTGTAAVVRSESEPVLARLPGQHGSTTAAERLVPLLVHSADAAR